MTEKIRVLQIIAGFALESPLGGIERFVIELSQALDRERYEPVVFGLWDWGTPYDGYWQDQLAQAGIRTFTGAAWADDTPYTAFKQSMAGVWANFGEEVDIIHSHSQFGDVAALILRRRLKAQRLVRTVHNEREWAKQPARRLLLTNGVYPLTFDAELGVSKQVVENLDRRPLARLLGHKGLVGYNALNIARFAAPNQAGGLLRQALGLPADGLVVGSVGRLTTQKGYRFLLQAFPAVLAQCPTAYLLIAGGGELKAELEAEARLLGIAERVRIPGPLSGIERVYAALDLFVSSSLWEGLPTVVLEAMAAGLPVVATAVSGNTELVLPGQTGLLVPPGEPTALAEAIVHLLTQPEQAAQYSARARQLIVPNFDIEQIARQHEELYRQLLAER
ncbi:MAG: glycosyltransferase family 4 protein [Caldilineaceae bacterium]|nr:glycosyltransferase family 4 protein [Caldilineaceae bacterium]